MWMPFLDEHGEPLRVIPLVQAPATKPYFQLARPIGFREHEKARTYWVPAHEASADPASGDRTDLASVPPFLQGFIATYGRQSAPAILHDHRRQVTNQLIVASQLGAADALGQAEEDDRVFRVALRQQKVPLIRSWLMWAFVSVERYWLYARWRAVLLVAQAVLAIVVVPAAIVLAFRSPLWLLLLVVPAVLAVAWGRRYALVLWLGYGSALMAPLVALQLGALAPFRLVEWLARETIDRPFIDPEPGPVAVPFGRAR
jgi:hypothetical protein